MACYFGCSTGANKFAYCMYFVLLIGSVGLWVWFVLGMTSCVNTSGNTTACQNFFDDVGGSPTVSITTSLEGSSAEQIGQICEGYGFEAGSPEYQDCDQCITTFYDCAKNNVWLFYTAIVLGILTLIPCFFCCCCATSPGKSYMA